MFKHYAIVPAPTGVAMDPMHPFTVFASFVPYRAQSWHTHPLGTTGDSLVTITLRSRSAKNHLVELDTAGTIKLLPDLVFGVTLDEKDPTIAQHPSLIAAGVVGSDSTYKAAVKLHKFYGWQPMHPEQD
jgi:hypothetical protein